MMYYPYAPNMDWSLADGYDPLITKQPAKRPRCDGCGKFLKLTETYLMVEQAYLKSHMKEECLTKVQQKAQERREEFELAALGAKKYGKQ